MGLPVVTICPPFPPFTKSDFFSAIAISVCLARDQYDLAVVSEPKYALVNSQAKDRQIKRCQHPTHKNCHKNENQRFNQGHGRSQSRLYIFLVEVSHRIQHRRERASRLADFNHLNGKGREYVLLFLSVSLPLFLADAGA